MGKRVKGLSGGGGEHRGRFKSLPDPYPRSVARGSRGGGGGLKIVFRVLGAFLNSLFHSEHFEYTHVGSNVLLPFIRNEKIGGCSADAQRHPSKQQCKIQSNINNCNLMHGFCPIVCRGSFLRSRPCTHLHTYTTTYAFSGSPKRPKVYNPCLPLCR